jgi:hypothetical protein
MQDTGYGETTHILAFGSKTKKSKAIIPLEQRESGLADE